MKLDRRAAITSIAGGYPEGGMAAHTASKAALISPVRSINTQENEHGVLATAISPALIATDLSAWTNLPTKAMIAVEDIVKVVGLLLSVSPRTSLPHDTINRVRAGPYGA